MKTLFRVLGAAAAVAVTSVAIVALDKVLNDKGSLHVEEVEFPEDAEKDPEEAAKTAEAYAEGEAKAEHTPTEPGAAWPPAFAKEDGQPPEPRKLHLPWKQPRPRRLRPPQSRKRPKRSPQPAKCP